MHQPVDIARLLAATYGHQVPDMVMYPFGAALVGRLALAAHEGNQAQVVAAVAELVEPLVANPAALFDGGPFLATGCFADVLARDSGDSRYVSFLRGLADRYAPDDGVRVEDFFFAGTLLGRTYRATGERRYADTLMDMLLNADTMQDDGLYWHCHQSPWYWGRGNAFAALGIAEALTFVEGHPLRDELVARNAVHLARVAELQDESGLWRQLIDDPSTYLEHSATTMLGCAISRGIRLGWLGAEEFESVAERAWHGTAARIGDGGELQQVCVGTPPLSDRADYVTREATDGLDDRGGAMALWFAIERAGIEV